VGSALLCSSGYSCRNAHGRGSARKKTQEPRATVGARLKSAFCSRPIRMPFGFPGHAFAGFSEEPRDQARTFRAVGHTVAASAGPAPIVFTYFGGASAAGRQAEEHYTHMKQACLTLQVDRTIYQRATHFTLDGRFSIAAGPR
jgi:hypothetical protein